MQLGGDSPCGGSAFPPSCPLTLPRGGAGGSTSGPEGRRDSGGGGAMTPAPEAPLAMATPVLALRACVGGPPSSEGRGGRGGMEDLFLTMGTGSGGGGGRIRALTVGRSSMIVHCAIPSARRGCVQ
jgi:hypothetical protein